MVEFFWLWTIAGAILMLVFWLHDLLTAYCAKRADRKREERRIAFLQEIGRVTLGAPRFSPPADTPPMNTKRERS